MIKKRGLLLIIVSLALGLAAAWLANNWVQRRLAVAEANDATGVSVVTATVPIPFGAQVEARFLKVVEIPKEAVPSDAFNDPTEVEGLIATQNILEGEILLKPRFSNTTSGSTFAATIKQNMRAMTVRVNDVIGVAGFLLPGNKVDVLATRMVDRRAITETILRDINVLAVDQKANAEKDQPVVVRAVTLEVTPTQAEILVKAREEGTIQLTLRNPLEDEPIVEQVKTEPKEPKKVVVVRAAPPPAAPSHSTVTVIRGTNVDTARTSE